MDCFRKVFRAARIKKARLYMTACGLYEAAINGQRVGDFVRAPGITDYRKRIAVEFAAEAVLYFTVRIHR